MEISKQYNLDPIKVYEIQSEFECLIEMSKSDESDSGLKDLIGNIDKQETQTSMFEDTNEQAEDDEQ